LKKLVIVLLSLIQKPHLHSKLKSLPIPINEVDISNLELPQSVAANASFERMFGYTQAEIRSLFIREGTKGMMRLFHPNSNIGDVGISGRSHETSSIGYLLLCTD